MISKTKRVDFHETIEGKGQVTYGFTSDWGTFKSNTEGLYEAAYFCGETEYSKLKDVKDPAVKEHMIARLDALRPIARQVLGLQAVKRAGGC